MNNQELAQRLEQLPSEFRVKKEDIESLINSAEIEKHIFWEKEMVVSFKLPCGFTVSGRSACIDPRNFDEEIGFTLCKQDAENQLWQLEGYRRQNIWHQERTS